MLRPISFSIIALGYLSSLTGCYRPNGRYCDETIGCPAGLACNLDVHSCAPADTIPTGLSIDSVTPAVGSIAGGETITISGHGFQEGATVSFGGVSAIFVERKGDTTIVVRTPTAVAGLCGLTTVEVQNPDQTKVQRGDLFRWTVSMVSFASRPMVSAGTAHISLSVGDFDGDGRSDALTVQGSTGNYSYFRGDGTFGLSRTQLTQPLSYNRTLPINYDNSGGKDFILYNTLASSFLLLGGDSGAMFMPIGPVQSIQARQVIEVPRSGAGSNFLVVSTNNALQFFENNSPLRPRLVSSVPTLSDVFLAAVGDVDGDQIPDIATFGQAPPQPLTFYKGESFTSYTASTVVAVTNPRAVYIVDLNGDKKAEIVTFTGTGSTTTMNIYHYSGVNTFSVEPDPLIINGVIDKARFQDLTCDGLPELIVNPAGTGEIRYLRNQSTSIASSFGVEKSLFSLTGFALDSFELGAFNDDNRMDVLLLSTDGNLTVLPNESE